MLKINSPFNSAGKQFNWEGDPTGIGISVNYLRNLPQNEKIRIQLGRKIYSMTKERAREIYHGMEKRNKWRRDEGSVWLVVLPLKEFLLEE